MQLRVSAMVSMEASTRYVRPIPFLLSYVRDHAHQRLPPYELMTTCVLTVVETLAVLQLLDFCFLRRSSFGSCG